MSGPFDQFIGQLGIDEIMGETESNAKDQQDATYEQAALGDHTRQVFERPEVAMNDSGDDQRVGGGNRGSFDRSGHAEERDESDNGDEHFPFGVPESGPGLRPFEGRPQSCVFGAFANAPPGSENKKDDAWADTA